MEVLSQAMCDALGLPPGSVPGDLLNYINVVDDGVLDGLLTTEEARSEAEKALVERDSYRLLIVPQIGPIQERYCSLDIDGLNKPVLVGLLGAPASPTLPTALENLVFWALIDPGLSWHDKWQDTHTGRASDWRKVSNGQAIIAVPTEAPPEVRRLVSAIFALEHSEIGVSQWAPPLGYQSTTMRLSTPVKSLTLLQVRLLNEASTINHPKWRCLALYRVLEHGYLANIKKKLIADFDADATSAIEEALDKVANEVNQLVSLAEEADLKTEFEEFDVEVEALIGANNQFIYKLDRGAKAHQLYRSPDRYKKAVVRFYKLRCAIAHAGASSVIYEQFPDSDAAATKLLPSIEAIALKSLKITT